MQGMSLSLEILEEKDGNKGRYWVTSNNSLSSIRAWGLVPFLDQSYSLQNLKAGLKVTGGVN